MTLPGECVNDNKTTCSECGEELEIGVYRSAAGYYIGFFCPNDGPYSRESMYYKTREEAELVLDQDRYFRI